MIYLFVYIILTVTFFVITFVFPLEHEYASVGILMALLVNHILNVYQSAHKKIEGDIILKKIKHTISLSNAMMAFFGGVFFLIDHHDKIYIVFVSTFLLFDFAEFFLIRKFPKDSLIIRDSEFLYNGLFFLARRNLKKLIKVREQDIGDYIVFTFKKDSSISVRRNDYDQEQLKEFINRAVQLSEEKVEIAPDVDTRLK